MPSIQNLQNMNKAQLSKTILLFCCSGLLVACGSGGSDTSRITPEPEPPKTEKPIISFNLTAGIPMQIINAQVRIEAIGQTDVIYENKKFSGFYAELTDLDFNKYRNKIILVTVSGDDQTRMYDPILNQFVPFNGSLHHIAEANSTNMKLMVTPTSEAIFQRTLVRSNQISLNNPDLGLITRLHIQKSSTEITHSLLEPFTSATNISPEFGNNHNITQVKFSDTNARAYTSLFLGLGYMNYFKTKFPSTQNTYLELGQSLGIDLRDGHFDGRTLHGDPTPFKALVNAPKNTNPLNNSLLKIGEHQKTTRENFGQALKEATLDYAVDQAFQNTLNAQGVKYLENFQYYTKQFTIDSDTVFRWGGAGDYRAAFGLKTVESCSNGLNPCRQGLNVDDLSTYVNDVEYLIGEHQVGQCKVNFYPNGNVVITRGTQIYRNSLNRDLSDNLQQVNLDPTHYILNVGASENRPAYFLQFEIKDMEILKARTGYNHDIYATTLETSEMDCSS